MSKKNRRLESLFVLSEIISTAESENRDKLKEDIISDNIDWLTVVEIANRHYLTAALYYSLLDKNLLQYINDEELLEYLEQIYSINLERNRKIVKQSKEINDLLTKEDIKPLFLKGSASLLQDDYPDLGMRYLGDIDFYVFEKDFQRAKEKLLSNGYTPYISENMNVERHHHWWPMIHPDWDVVVELHKRVLAYNYSHFMERKKNNMHYSRCCTNLAILSPTFRLIHAFVHSEIIDRTYELKRINIRQLYEQSIIIEKYNKQIDWNYIESLFVTYKVIDRFNYNLVLINDLFGANTPLTKQDYRNTMALKILYFFFKYRKSIFIHLYSNIQLLKFAFSHNTMHDMCVIDTKRDYIDCLFRQIKRGFHHWKAGKYRR